VEIPISWLVVAEVVLILAEAQVARVSAVLAVAVAEALEMA
jgi:hypothetical protein